SDGNQPWFMLWAAYKWTGDKKYLVPLGDDPPEWLRLINADVLDILNVRDTWGKQLLQTTAPDRRTESGTASETNLHFNWQLTGDTKPLEKLYTSQIQTATERKFINTEGSLWIDRIYFNNGELQRGRLGGVALMRNYVYPGNVVSWKFEAPATEQSVAILVPVGTPNHIKITAYNLDSKPVLASMTGWEIDPGKWEMTVSYPQGDAVAAIPPSTVDFEREDVKMMKGGLTVTVHSLGAVDAPPATVVVRDRAGNVVAKARTPMLKAPVDLLPKKATVTLRLPSKADLTGGSVTIESSGKVPEITQLNNRVTL